MFQLLFFAFITGVIRVVFVFCAAYIISTYLA